MSSDSRNSELEKTQLSPSSVGTVWDFSRTRTVAIRKLVLIVPDLRKIVILPGETITVGRTTESTVCIEADKLLSRRHFSIECRKDGAFITDLQSTNGTAHNGERIQTAELQNADQISAGLTRFVVLIH